MGALRRILQSELEASDAALTSPAVEVWLSKKSLNINIQKIVLGELQKLQSPSNEHARDALLFLLDCWESSGQPLTVQGEVIVEYENTKGTAGTIMDVRGVLENADKFRALGISRSYIQDALGLAPELKSALQNIYEGKRIGAMPAHVRARVETRDVSEDPWPMEAKPRASSNRANPIKIERPPEPVKSTVLKPVEEVVPVVKESRVLTSLPELAQPKVPAIPTLAPLETKKDDATEKRTKVETPANAADNAHSSRRPTKLPPQKKRQLDSGLAKVTKQEAPIPSMGNISLTPTFLRSLGVMRADGSLNTSDDAELDAARKVLYKVSVNGMVTGQQQITAAIAFIRSKAQERKF